MKKSKTDALNLISAERDTQLERVGVEHDVEKYPNDWISTIASHLTEASSRNGVNPSAEEFERALVKSAAIIVAAIEHGEMMKEKRRLS